ncbi:hypothetical protein M9H77_17686 [Catharanthus roseus]|uniref:Uncharacterized protein n=1 Tax=Catharanthus roseus TaxID=4058 RepID=A0ACC0B5A7_CATRO|nr:hypothetical protein M9H77_17686 [Catharanthus roseus]
MYENRRDGKRLDWMTEQFHSRMTVSTRSRRQLRGIKLRGVVTRAPGQMAFLFTNTYEKKTPVRPGCQFCLRYYVRKRQRIALYMASPCTRASSYGVEDSDSGEWIHLRRGIDRGGCGPIGLRGHRIMLYGGVQPPSGESGGVRN